MGAHAVNTVELTSGSGCQALLHDFDSCRERVFLCGVRVLAGVDDVFAGGVESTRFLSPPSRRLGLTCGEAGSGVVSAVPRDRNRARAARLPVPAFLFMPRHSSRRDLEVALADARGQLRRHERELQTLREEADVLREAAETLIHHAPARERFAFVHELRDRFPARRICRIIATDHAGYFAWARAEKTRTARKLDDEQLLQLIIEVHTAHPAYGAERITRELKLQGTDVGRRLPGSCARTASPESPAASAVI